MLDARHAARLLQPMQVWLTAKQSMLPCEPLYARCSWHLAAARLMCQRSGSATRLCHTVGTACKQGWGLALPVFVALLGCTLA